MLFANLAFDVMCFISLKNKMAAKRTGNNCNSVNMPLRNEISPAIPMFSWSDNTRITSNTEFITLLPEIKMAAAKPEVAISQPTCHLEMEFQRLYVYVRL